MSKNTLSLLTCSRTLPRMAALLRHEQEQDSILCGLLGVFVQFLTRRRLIIGSEVNIHAHGRNLLTFEMIISRQK